MRLAIIIFAFILGGAWEHLDRILEIHGVGITVRILCAAGATALACLVIAGLIELTE